MDDVHYMKLALAEAEKAFAEEEVPVGAVIVLNNRIIARGFQWRVIFFIRFIFWV